MAAPLRGSSSPIRNSHSLCSAEADYDVGGDSARHPAHRIAVSSQSLLARAPDTITHREQRSKQPRHVGTAAGACTRGGRAEMARPGRAPMRAFARAPSQRAVAALLQRRAIPRAPARGHSAEREVGGDRGVTQPPQSCPSTPTRSPISRPAAPLEAAGPVFDPIPARRHGQRSSSLANAQDKPITTNP